MLGCALKVEDILLLFLLPASWNADGLGGHLEP